MPKEKNNLALFKNKKKIRKIRAINLLTPQEVAERLRLTRRTIMKYIREGKIKAIKLNRRIYRISEKDLNVFLKKCKRK
ncbi:helix-turn-helix domain-containing protein [bacterium]|nr:helix-turn-helix domain-containing protein [bacterium]